GALSGGFTFLAGANVARPWEGGVFCATVSEPEVKVNHAWFRGGWFDALTLAWKDVQEGAAYDRPPVTEGEPAPGASLFVPFRLGGGESRTITVRLTWYCGVSDLRIGEDPKEPAASNGVAQE